MDIACIRELWLLFLLANFIHISNAALPKHPITVTGNGYEGVTIAISSKVKVSKDSEGYFVSQLEDIMTEASSVLYNATRKRLYFKDITIVLPKSWSMDTGGKFVSGPQFDLSHIIVDLKSIDPVRPYVFGMTECGVQGQYIHLTNQAVLTVNKYQLGKTMVHEWGHFRWGLFDEYPETENIVVGKQRVAYTDGGTFKPNLCTEEVQGKFLLNCQDSSSKCRTDDNGLLEKECRFCPSVSNAKASLMGYHYLPSIIEFCDSSGNDDSSVRHNAKADTKQNKYCGRKSAWEVMRDHDDFKSTVPGQNPQDTTPTFRIVKQGLTQIVLVLDVSGSMKTNDKLSKLRLACTEYINGRIKEDSVVGIVTFNEAALVVHPLTKVTSDYDRSSLVDALPSIAKGGTSIGAGLLKGLDILEASGNEVIGSYLILVSDGKNTNAPSIEDVQKTIVDSGVIVTSLAFTELSDPKMVALAAATGGQSFFISGSATSTALIDAFTQGIKSDDTFEGVLSQLDSLAIMVSKGNSYTGSFDIDPSIGRNTKISITGGDVSSVQLIATSSINNDSFSSTKTSADIINLAFPEFIETGKYSYQVTSTAVSDINLVVNIVSSQRDAEEQPIVARVWTSKKTLDFGTMKFIKVFASVNKGRTPVLGANIIVDIEDSTGRTIEIILEDNGSGSDIEKDDGIYSAYILPHYISSNGRHNIKLKATTVEGMTRVPVPLEINKNRTRRDVDEDTFKLDYDMNYTQAEVPYKMVLIEPFQRISQGGDFIVSNFDAISTLTSDGIAPARITTLKVEERHEETFTLTWVAVGDDLDTGRASSYKILISEDFEEMITETVDESDWNITSPEPRFAGEKQNISITFTKSNTTYFVGIKAVDDMGNEGELSNIVSVSIIIDKQWLPESSTQTTHVASSTEISDSDKKVEKNTTHRRSPPTGMIVGIVVTCVVLVIVCIVLIVIYLRRRRRSYSTDKEMIPVPTEEV